MRKGVSMELEPCEQYHHRTPLKVTSASCLYYHGGPEDIPTW